MPDCILVMIACFTHAAKCSSRLRLPPLPLTAADYGNLIAPLPSNRPAVCGDLLVALTVTVCPLPAQWLSSG